MPDNPGKICLITGASRGLGKVLAEYFWRCGWGLILVSRDLDALDRVATSILEKNSGQVLHTIQANLARSEEVDRVGEKVKSLVPKLDAFINNAAIQGPIGPAWENGWDLWLETLRVDLLAPVALCRIFATWMVANGGGSIINLSGGGATGPRENFSAYATAKTGLVRFSETLAEELKRYHVRVNCIAPGVMPTDMLKEVIEKGRSVAGNKEIEAAVRAMESPGVSMLRVAELCGWLVSDDAKLITGKLISAVWDPWPSFPEHVDDLNQTDIYTLRRIVPQDRGMTWGNDL